MIGRISGRLAYRAPDHVLIDTGGVGYIVQCSDRTIAALPAPGAPVALWTDLVVREDLLQLIGFPTLQEREWHRLLTSVQGVGVKVALAIVSRLGPEGVARALATGDQAAIRSAPGVGPKLAARLVTELRDRAPAVMALAWDGAEPVADPPAGSPAPMPTETGPGPARPAPAATAEALSALVNLGWGQGEAAIAVAEAAAADPSLPTPALIRSALRRLAPKV
jgi:Holliday junction DNA helicase RuvA